MCLLSDSRCRKCLFWTKGCLALDDVFVLVQWGLSDSWCRRYIGTMRFVLIVVGLSQCCSVIFVAMLCSDNLLSMTRETDVLTVCGYWQLRQDCECL